ANAWTVRQRPFPNKANAPGVKKILRRSRFQIFRDRQCAGKRDGWLASQLRAGIRASTSMLMTATADRQPADCWRTICDRESGPAAARIAVAGVEKRAAPAMGLIIRGKFVAQ